MVTSRKRKEAQDQDVTWIEAGAPNFVKLGAGESCHGVYIGPTPTKYGTSYRFRVGEETFILSGNRVQLDRIMEELHGHPAFSDRNPTGHFIKVMRGKDVESSTGRMVAQYKVGHSVKLCPKCSPSGPSTNGITDDDLPF